MQPNTTMRTPGLKLVGDKVRVPPKLYATSSKRLYKDNEENISERSSISLSQTMCADSQKSSAQNGLMPWNRDDILNEDHKGMNRANIYKHLMFNFRHDFPTLNPIDGTPSDVDNKNNYYQYHCYNQDLFEHKHNKDVRPLNEIKDELLEDYQEYNGELPDGNLIKTKLWIEINYLIHVIKYSYEVNFFHNYLSKVYLYSLAMKTATDSPNYDEIHDKVIAWVNQDPNTYAGSTEENRKKFLESIESSLPVRSDLYDIKQAKSDMSKEIDGLLDFLHENLDKLKSDVKNYKIWRLGDFYRCFNDINVKYNLDLKAKLNSILKPIVYQLLEAICIPQANRARGRVMRWASEYNDTSDTWRLLDGYPPYEPERLKSYSPLRGVHSGIFEVFSDEMVEGPIPCINLVQPSVEIKKKYKATIIDILTALLTESSNQFEAIRRLQEQKLTTIVSENLCRGFEPHVE